MDLIQYRMGISGLCAYRQLADKEEGQERGGALWQLDALLNQIYWTQDAEEINKSFQCMIALEEYGRLFQMLREGQYLGLGDYLWDVLRFTPTLYGRMLAEGISDPALENGARREIDFLLGLCKLDSEVIFSWLRPCVPMEYQGIFGDLPRLSSHCPFDFESLTAWHREHGYGIFAQHSYFLWQGGEVVPVVSPSVRRYEHLHGFDLQRKQVLDNTSLLVSGKKAQNVLLFGDGGTGKSALVKSMPSAFPGLKLIQVPQEELSSLPTLMTILGKRKEKFLIFIDDLVFDQDDDRYSALKSILEGGLLTPPSHVVVYGTSNRRHLVRQTFSERAGEEVDMFETIAEKTALAQRFGLRIPYMTMSKEDYLDLVGYFYREKGKNALQKEALEQQAMMWEIRHGGRSPRVAEQFVDSLG